MRELARGLARAGLAAAVLLGEPVGARPAADPPNVLVVVLDDVGVDKLSTYPVQGVKARTPCLDALANAGLRFERAYGSPLCSPFRAAMLTGRHAFRTGVGNTVSAQDNHPIPAQEITLPEAVAAATAPGLYLVEAYQKWHVSTTSGALHEDRDPVDGAGFSRWIGHMGNLTPASKNVDPPGALTGHYYWRRIEALPTTTGADIVGSPSGPFDTTTYANSVMRAHIAERLAAHAAGAQRFVLIWGQFAPHAPHVVPPHDGTGYDEGSTASLVSRPTLDGEKVGGGVHAQGGLPAPSAKAAGIGLATAAQQHEQRIQWFNAQLEAADRDLALLLSGMDAAQLARTLILVVSDNGTPSDAIDAAQFGLGPYDVAHAKGSVYEQGVRVPLIAANIASLVYDGRPGEPSYRTTPGILPYPAERGACTDALVAAVDLFPTVLELCGAELALAIPDGRAIDGVSFLPVLEGKGGLRESVFCEAFAPNGLGGTKTSLVRSLLREDGWKYVLDAPHEHLFQVFVDPLEQDDEKLSWPGIFAALKAQVAALTGEQLYQGPPLATFCDATDGALASCPCSNPGAPESGCDTAQGTGGVLATLIAQASQGATIAGSGFPPDASPATLVMRSGEREAAPVVFGDGLRCVGLSGFARLAATTASGGGSTHPIGHTAGPGVFHYQLWFRNAPIGYCDPAAAWNLSNGLSLGW